MSRWIEDRSMMPLREPDRIVTRALPRIIFLLAISTALAICGCSEQNGTRLFIARQHVTKEGGIWPYAVFVPDTRASDEKLPVILFLNGWGENGTDGLRQISNNLGGDIWRMRDHFPFLAICPQCAYNGSWELGSKNATMAMAVLDEALAEFGGDPERVAISGPSAGGSGAILLALANPDRFSAVVPLSADIACDAKTLRQSGLPIWCFYNGRDVAALVSSVRQSRRLLLESGLSPLVTEFDEAGHNSWDNAYSSPALYHWLLQQSSNARGLQGGFSFLKPDALLKTWTTTDPQRWRTDLDEIVATGDPPSPSSLTSSPLTADFEIHCDVLLHGNSHLALADDAGRPLLELTLETSDTGQGSWTDSTGRVIGTLDVIGQRALRPGWNDIRLSRSGTRFKLLLNGWPASEIEDPTGGSALRFALVIGAKQKDARWRFIRQRQGSKHDNLSGEP